MRSGRSMNGYGSHPYLWENAGGEKFWVEYHFKTDQGIEFFPDAEAKAMTAEDPDYHMRDLYRWASGPRPQPGEPLRRDQAGTMVRTVLDDAARARLVHNIVEHLKADVEPCILRAAVEYWKQVDANRGARVAQGVGLREAVPTGEGTAVIGRVSTSAVVSNNACAFGSSILPASSRSCRRVSLSMLFNLIVWCRRSFSGYSL